MPGYIRAYSAFECFYFRSLLVTRHGPHSFIVFLYDRFDYRYSLVVNSHWWR